MIESQKPGTVSIVGAGPGDPGLLTLRALSRLKEADVVVHDHLVSDAILSFVSARTELLYAGKWAGERVMSQSDIEDYLVRLAREGKRVVRLKGGDVFLFGRGGEECSRLHEEGIEYEVVPGVSSALAVPAYAGIPVTDRRHSSSFLVVTGHEGSDNGPGRVRWEKIANATDTLVILMGTRRIAEIAEVLQANGREGTSPAAMISWGTTGAQQTRVAELQNLAASCTELQAPSVIVVGDVVGLRDSLSWFESLPLFGLRVLNTRPKGRAGGATRALSALGAQVFSHPLLHCVPGGGDAEEAFRRKLEGADWLVLTSVHAAETLADWSVNWPSTLQVAVVGDSTAEAAKRAGLSVDLIPEKAHAEALCDALIQRAGSLHGSRILFARGSRVKDTVERVLGKAGAEVDSCVVYSVEQRRARELAPLRQLLAADGVDITLVTSPYSVKVLASQIPAGGRIPVVALSESVAESARAVGLSVEGVAEAPGTAELVAAIQAWAVEAKREATS